MRLREWLIVKLAGGRTVVVNAELNAGNWPSAKRAAGILEPKFTGAAESLSWHEDWNGKRYYNADSLKRDIALLWPQRHRRFQRHLIRSFVAEARRRRPPS